MSDQQHPFDERPWLDSYPPGLGADVGELPCASLGELVTVAAREHGDRPAFTNLGLSLSFTRLDELVSSFARWLSQDLGLQPGDRLAIQMPNVLQYPVVFYGALRAGLTVVGLNPMYTSAEMATVLADSRPRAIVVLANFADKVEAVLPESSLEHVIITEVGDLLPWPKRSIVNTVVKRVKKMVPAYRLPNALPLRPGLSGGAGSWQPPSIGPDDIALLQYTGGTTGGTKAAILTHRNLLVNQEQFLGMLASAFDEGHPRVIAALPMYHVFSLTVNLIGFFRFGAENILITNPRDTADFVSTLRQTRPQAIILVSTLAGALIDAPGFAELDHSRLRITVAGGMALRSSVADGWHEATGHHIIEGYGLTEASPVVSVNPPHLEPRRGTIGVPLPSTQVRLVEISGDGDVEPGEPGELCLRGPQVMRGYWEKPEETAQTITEDGWLHTGDIATISDDGYLTIVDRKKELIVVSGFNVYPGEIEDAAMQHPGVVEAGVIGVEDEHSGEVPVLFAVRRGEEPDVDELTAFLRERLTGYKRPKRIIFRTELPKTAVGKILRRELKDLVPED